MVDYPNYDSATPIDPSAVGSPATGVSPVAAELLAPLSPNRRMHSLEVGRKAETAAHLVAPHMRKEVITAAYLHDVGYGHPAMGFHPLDGARLLKDLGYSDAVCHLVAHHTGATVEARHRGISPAEFAPFASADPDVIAANEVIWWADLTTGPSGETLSVQERIDEILSRYGPDHVVSQYVRNIAPKFIAVAQAIEESMKGAE